MTKQTNTEVIVERIEGLRALTEERFNENQRDHNELVAQARQTNGRVKALEKWRYGLAGAIAVLTTLAIPLLVEYLKNHLVV